MEQWEPNVGIEPLDKPKYEVVLYDYYSTKRRTVQTAIILTQNVRKSRDRPL
jgi:hypothetical protein